MAKETAERKRPWRENIEALTMAIAVALLFKVFFLEISKIPSGSMQPTLMGDPGSDTFDRIAVDKLSYHFRDPQRWEIVVFKHPLERSRVMVKRLVGMPGEDLKIEHGDLWRRADAGAAWEHLRRPDPLQRAMWKSLETRDVTRSSWRALDTEDWRFQGRSIKASGPGSARYERSPQGSILALYTDGYADALRAEVKASPAPTHRVGDVRLEGSVTARTGTVAVEVELSEGGLIYAFRLPGPAGGPGDPARIEVRDRRTRATLSSRAAEGALRLVAGEALAFAVENLDDRLRFEVDGRIVAQVDVDPVPEQHASIVLRVEGEGAELDDLLPYRDVYYYDSDPQRPQPWTVTIPPGNYVMLGDNTQDSADGRDWTYTSFSWDQGDGPRSEIGNFREPGASGQNPIPIAFAGAGAGAEGSQGGYVFRDRWGDCYWLRQDEISGMRLDGKGVPAPLVPRELLLGRAVAVFWPLQPTRMLWRLGWLR